MIARMTTDQLDAMWKRAPCGYVSPVTWFGATREKAELARALLAEHGTEAMPAPRVRFLQMAAGVAMIVHDGRHRIAALREVGAAHIEVEICSGSELLSLS
jgi:hypothetical protein